MKHHETSWNHEICVTGAFAVTRIATTATAAYPVATATPPRQAVSWPRNNTIYIDLFVRILQHFTSKNRLWMTLTSWCVSIFWTSRSWHLALTCYAFIAVNPKVSMLLPAQTSPFVPQLRPVWPHFEALEPQFQLKILKPWQSKLWFWGHLRTLWGFKESTSRL